MRQFFVLTLYACLQWTAWGQTAYEYRYWFDNDMSSAKAIQSSTSELHIDADVSGLSNTLHTIHIQVKDKDSVWSVPTTRYFLKTPNNILKYHYWIDNDISNVRSYSSNNGPVMIDVSSLEDGFHVLHFQTDDDVTTSSPLTKMFIKIPQTEGVDSLKCISIIDGNLYKQENVLSHNGTIFWNLDVNNLQQGLHSMLVQVFTPSGSATNIYKSFFLRTTTDEECAEMQCFYSIDEGEVNWQTGIYTDGAFHFELDVESLEDGEHYITYFLSDGYETTTQILTASFVKTSSGISEINETHVDTLKQDTPIYDLYGKVVTQKLRPGIYIKNGKKIRVE